MYLFIQLLSVINFLVPIPHAATHTWIIYIDLFSLMLTIMIIMKAVPEYFLELDTKTLAEQSNWPLNFSFLIFYFTHNAAAQIMKETESRINICFLTSIILEYLDKRIVRLYWAGSKIRYSKYNLWMIQYNKEVKKNYKKGRANFF